MDFEFYYGRRNLWFQHNLTVQKKKDHKSVLFARSIKLSSKKKHAAYRAWGNLYSESNYREKGLLKLKRALAIKPDAWEIAQEIAHSLKTLSKLEEALVYIQQALEFGPDAKSIHMRFLEILQMLGKLEDFESYYQQFLSLNPLKRSPSFYYAKAEALVGLEKHGFSLPSYKIALELAPEHPHYHFQYGMALYYEGLWAEALTLSLDKIYLEMV